MSEHERQPEGEFCHCPRCGGRRRNPSEGRVRLAVCAWCGHIWDWREERALRLVSGATGEGVRT